MMDKRKLDGAMEESSTKQHICQSDATVYISCSKSGAIHLAELGITAGW